MNDHFRGVRNMISDTPRTDAVNQYLRTRDDYTKTDHEVWINHGCDIERELNAANDMFRKLNIHALNLTDRIKRLEEDSQRLNWLLNRGLAWRDCYNDWWKEGEWLYASQSALEIIDKAKEAK